MQWSKTKATLESFLCDKLKDRIQIHATVYRKFYDSPARVWITFDQKEILNAADVSYQIKHEKVYQQIKKEEHLKSIPFNSDLLSMYYSPERKLLSKASDKADAILMNQSIFSSYQLYEPLMQYSLLSIEKALSSENVIIQAFALFDRRLGKRRLRNLQFSVDTHPIILKFYRIRCGVEGIPVTK